MQTARHLTRPVFYAAKFKVRSGGELASASLNIGRLHLWNIVPKQHLLQNIPISQTSYKIDLTDPDTTLLK
jgi:hypothetical protein